MSTQTQLNAAYYANLLILQYLQKAKAYATIQNTVLPALLGASDQQYVSFSVTPVSGTFKLAYLGVETSTLQWNDNAATIQTAFNLILTSPLAATVTGSVADGLVITFTGFTDVVEMVTVSVNTILGAGSVSAISQVVSVGDQLPLEVQDAFNLNGSSVATGVQLDVIGQYVGVTRAGYGFVGPVSLDDSDFLKLIQMGIVRNKSKSSLASIQLLLNQFFADEVFLFDYTNMNMSYLIDTSIGSQNLIYLFVNEGLLPKPMGVGISVIAVAALDLLFGFVTYDSPTQFNNTPFNNYDTYDSSWVWVSYNNSIG